MKAISKHFSQSFLTVAALVLTLSITFFSCSKDEDSPITDKKTFVLVHGAFQAAYTWDGVKAALEQQGNKVIVVELPGHGADLTDPSIITMDTYRDKVVAATNQVSGKVVLVGHSMGGMVISAVAEAVPNKIERLIYLGAFVPTNGQSLLELASMDTEGHLAPLLIPAADHLTLIISDINQIPFIFCEDGSAKTKQLLIDQYRPDPAIPFNNPLTLTAPNFGSVTKSYIHTANDQALGLALQNQMVASGNITDVYTIQSSHTPHLSKTAELTQLLISIAK
jgi:pimeloyl-ACP methyl ester carboxylesterase